MKKNCREVLEILQEECAEVIQAVSKCFRFGIYTVSPITNESNKDHLTEELGDLIAMINLCVEFGIVDSKQIMEASAAKIDKLKKWSKVYEK